MRNNLTSSILLIFLVLVSVARAQVPTHQNPIFRAPREIPEASLLCSPEEETWWTTIRKVGKAVRLSKGGKKELIKFTELLNEGAAKSYKVPIADQRPMNLNQVEPEYSDEGRLRNINGTVMLSAVVITDGTIDQIRITKGLGFGLDQKAIEAARKSAFLPAVKNGEFVRTFIQLEMNFNIYRIR